MYTVQRKVRFHPMLLVLPLTLTLLLSAEAPAQSGGEQGVKLTVLIHSGLPDPTMTLDEGAVARLEEMLAAAPANADFDGETVIPSILGYKGLMIENPSGQGNLPPLLMVYKGDLETQNGKTSFLTDASGTLEGFLVETAMAAGLLRTAEAQLVRSEVPAAAAEIEEPAEPEDN